MSRWQRNYYEHIVRNDNELRRIREYIGNNPAQWAVDRENPKKGVYQYAPTDGIDSIFGGTTVIVRKYDVLSDGRPSENR
jgi:hypothetical protein